MPVELDATKETELEDLTDPVVESPEPKVEEPQHPLLAGLPKMPPKVQEVLDKINELKAKQTKAQDSLNRVREQQERATKRLNESRQTLNDAYRDLGYAVTDDGVVTYDISGKGEKPREAVSKTDEPKTESGNWRNAPIAVLTITPAVAKAVIEENEITTVGQLAVYFESNATFQGLDGLTEKRAARLQVAYTEFIESQE